MVVARQAQGRTWAGTGHVPRHLHDARRRHCGTVPVAWVALSFDRRGGNTGCVGRLFHRPRIPALSSSPPLSVLVFMNRKRRQPPSEEKVQKLNRALAEMVVLGPSNQDVGGKPKTKSPEVKSKTRVKVKEEPIEPLLEPEATAAVAPLSKPITMSLVDFSLALSLVFGGCCRLVQEHTFGHAPPLTSYSNVWTYEYLLKLDSKMGNANPPLHDSH